MTKKRKPVKKVAKRNLYWETQPFRFPLIPTPQPTKGCNVAKPDAETKRFRTEIARRTQVLAEARLDVYRELGLTECETVAEFHERELELVRTQNRSYHHSPIYKGKGDKRKLVGWKPLLTPEQERVIAERLKPLAFTAEQVREEMKNA
jgi:hypothetical protein